MSSALEELGSRYKRMIQVFTHLVLLICVCVGVSLCVLVCLFCSLLHFVFIYRNIIWLSAISTDVKPINQYTGIFVILSYFFNKIRDYLVCIKVRCLCINPLTPNDLERRRAVSPLKIKIPSKNMREKPTNTPLTWCARTTSLDTTRPSTIFCRLFRN
jgi:hypothetical protein